MKTTININNKAVEIELTADQVEAIKKASEKITDRVKTFDDALAIVGASENLKILLAYNGQDVDMLASVAHAKLGIIAKALNEGWQPDWLNNQQPKYYPWFKQVGSAPVSRTATTSTISRLRLSAPALFLKRAI